MWLEEGGGGRALCREGGRGEDRGGDGEACCGRTNKSAYFWPLVVKRRYCNYSSRPPLIKVGRSACCASGGEGPGVASR